MDRSHSTLKNKISRGIGIIIKVKPFANKRCLSNLYHAFIYPYLRYCLEVWRNVLESHIKPLCLLLNKALRFINFSHYKASSDSIAYDITLAVANPGGAGACPPL